MTSGGERWCLQSAKIMDNYYYNYSYHHLVSQMESFKDQQIRNVNNIVKLNEKLNEDILELYKVIQMLLKSPKFLAAIAALYLGSSRTDSQD